MAAPVRSGPRLSDVLSRLQKVRSAGKNQWTALCPAHDDRNPSLSVGEGEGGRVLLTCHARCSYQDIVAALALERMPPHQENRAPMALERAERVYDYTDTHGNVLYKVARYANPKDFRPWSPDGRGGWKMGLGKNIERVPYRLRELRAAQPGDLLLLLEGEKDVERAEAEGFTATTTQGGAKNWRSHAGMMAHELKGRRVAIVPDADDAGDVYAADALATLAPVAASVAILHLPRLEHSSDHGLDLSDWFTTFGGTAAELRQLAEATLPHAISKAGSDYERNERNEQTQQDNSLDSFLSYASYPEPMAAEAFIGVAGDLIAAIEPHTEAAREALLIQFLAAFGNAAGRHAHFTAEADQHYTNLFPVLVAATGARKGTSWGHIRRFMERVDPLWTQEHILGGLSSGEGLIHAVRDEEEPDESNPLATDKRVLVLEPEFGAVLKVLARDGNTLSAILRQAWDGNTLRVLTRQAPAKATGAHISIVGHITREELIRHLSDTEAGNGFGNRILWICAKRSKSLPEGGQIEPAALNGAVECVRFALDFASRQGRMERDQDARALWAELYQRLSEGRPGLLGAMTARAEAQTMRLALLYALLDMSTVITADHLRAGYAVWRYAEESARFIFGMSLGDPVQDAILNALREKSPDGLARTDISGLFGRNRAAKEIGFALASLQARGLVSMQSVPTNGRPSETWFATPAGTSGKKA